MLGSLEVGVSVRSHTPPIRQPPSGPTCVHDAIQKSKVANICLPPPVSQSTPASISSISPQSSSDLDTDHGDIIDETIKKVTQSINQTLCASNIGGSTTNIASNNPHMTRLQTYKTPRHKPKYHTYTNKHTVNTYVQSTVNQRQHY